MQKPVKPPKSDRSETTLHVRNIPEGIKDDDLAEFFSEIGPVKFCFQVPGKNFGFVQFVMKDDANRAMTELAKIKFHGVNLSLSFSKHRNREQKDEPKVVTVRDRKQKQVAFIKEVKITNKTVVVDGLDASIVDKKVLFKKVKKFGDVVEVIYPACITSYSAATLDGVSNTK